jgi:hypothetical protein
MHARIQRPGFDLEQILRSPLDVLRDRVTVHRRREKRAEDQKLKRALQQLHAGRHRATHCVDSLLHAGVDTLRCVGKCTEARSIDIVS